MDYDAFRKEMDERGKRYYREVEKEKERLSGEEWISVLIIIGLIVYSLI